MAAIAEAGLDTVLITDDNPRAESGDVSVAHIVAGLSRPDAASIQRDRAQAIADAIAGARPGDVVLIAGKGHEPYQEIAGKRWPFDDMAIARAALGAWSRSEERRVGKECVSSVDLGGRRLMTQKKKNNMTQRKRI